MKFEISLCRSVIERVLRDVDAFDPTKYGRQALGEIYRRRVVLHDDLVQQYEDYFRDHRPELFDSFQSFFTAIANSSDTSEFLSSYSTHSLIDSATMSDYLKILFRICNATKDKILVSDLTGSYSSLVHTLGIAEITSTQLIDTSVDNILNRYRLPIIRKRISPGESSMDVSNWLAPFIKTETDFTIIDGYIYQNRGNFLSHFLNHVPHGSSLRIYTLTNRNATKTSIQTLFKSQQFSNWKIEVYLIPNKKDQHARNIFTNQYFIHIEKGMAAFGVGGKTDQSDITIDYRKSVVDASMPPAVKIV